MHECVLPLLQLYKTLAHPEHRVRIVFIVGIEVGQLSEHGQRVFAPAKLHEGQP